MKNRFLNLYLLTIGLVTIVSVDTLIHDKFKFLVNDDSRLSFHYSNSNTFDTTITLVNVENYPLDTIRRWTKRILDLKPKVLAIDIFSDSLQDVEKIDGTIILPIIGGDGNHFEYSKNNITTRQKHGVVLVDDYFRAKKYYEFDTEKLPSFALQVIKEFDLTKYSEVIKNENKELINYRSTNSFKIIDFLDLYPDDYLKLWIKDKIVIIGYLGYNGNHVPDMFDNNDSHVTPIGKIFGTVIIANEIQTLLGNRILELNKATILFFSLLILLGSSYLILRIKSNSRILIVLILNLVLILLIGLLSFISILVLNKYSFFISIELITISLILGFQIGIVNKLSKM